MPDVSADRSLATDARHWVSRMIRGAGAPPKDETAVALVASELVTNALMHTASPVAVAVDVAADRTRIEVWDGSPDAAACTRDPPHDETGGFGLAIVDRLSDAWGVCRADDRKYVWAEFRGATGVERRTPCA
jgi:anti-sigma regulatory factor (Ser/Thr protein kinase)